MSTKGPDVREALRELIRAYMRLMENGRDRICDLGGQCDPLDVMERSDPVLRAARAALAEPVQPAEGAPPLSEEVIVDLAGAKASRIYPSPRHGATIFEFRLPKLIAFVREIEARLASSSAPQPEVQSASPETALKAEPVAPDIAQEAADMLTAYAELVKATGKYAEMYYIPHVEYVIGALRAAAPEAHRG